jgi:2-oxoacid:acceptor oxidoreductase delta subunit (pyruvate/2-ketoisovalerate family)
MIGATIKHNLEKAPRTGSWRNMRPVVDKKKCIGCGTCVKYCPEAVIELKVENQELGIKNKEINTKERGKAEIDLEYCKGCGVCAVECPVKAILMKKE